MLSIKEACMVQRLSSCLDPNCMDEQHSLERDKYMLDILSTLIETSHTVIPLTNGGARKWDPDKNCPVTKAIPGWRAQVEPFREDSLFWHGIWLSAGRPNKGVL